MPLSALRIPYAHHPSILSQGETSAIQVDSEYVPCSIAQGCFDTAVRSFSSTNPPASPSDCGSSLNNANHLQHSDSHESHSVARPPIPRLQRKKSIIGLSIYAASFATKGCDPPMTSPTLCTVRSFEITSRTDSEFCDVAYNTQLCRNCATVDPQTKVDPAIRTTLQQIPDLIGCQPPASGLRTFDLPASSHHCKTEFSLKPPNVVSTHSNNSSSEVTSVTYLAVEQKPSIFTAQPLHQARSAPFRPKTTMSSLPSSVLYPTIDPMAMSLDRDSDDLTCWTHPINIFSSFDSPVEELERADSMIDSAETPMIPASTKSWKTGLNWRLRPASQEPQRRPASNSSSDIPVELHSNSYDAVQHPIRDDPVPKSTTGFTRFSMIFRKARPSHGSQQKASRKGPAAGTGHEGYGRFSFRKRRSSITNVNRQDSANSGSGHKRDWSIIQRGLNPQHRSEADLLGLRHVPTISWHDTRFSSNPIESEAFSLAHTLEVKEKSNETALADGDCASSIDSPIGMSSSDSYLRLDRSLSFSDLSENLTEADPWPHFDQVIDDIMPVHDPRERVCSSPFPKKDGPDIYKAYKGARLGTNPDVRFNALIASKWLSFDRVLFSPAHEKAEKGNNTRILVVDGLGKDWGYYCALTYPNAEIYSLEIGSLRAASSDRRKDLPNHRHIRHKALEIPFPFPGGLFTAVAIRFPIATTATRYDFLVYECHRVLEPKGYLEITTVDLDMTDMGAIARTELQMLKLNMYRQENQIILRSTGDVLAATARSHGFKGIRRCVVGIPVSGNIPNRPSSISNTRSTSAMNRCECPNSKSNVEDASLEIHSESSCICVDNDNVTRAMGEVGRWWHTTCFPALGASKLFESPGLLEECEKEGTSIRLQLSYAQKPRATGTRVSTTRLNASMSP